MHKKQVNFYHNCLYKKTKKMQLIQGLKIVLYRINDSRLVKTNTQEQENVKNSIVSLLDNELMNNFVRELEKIYEVRSSLDHTTAQ